MLPVAGIRAGVVEVLPVVGVDDAIALVGFPVTPRKPDVDVPGVDVLRCEVFVPHDIGTANLEAARTERLQREPEQALSLVNHELRVIAPGELLIEHVPAVGEIPGFDEFGRDAHLEVLRIHVIETADDQQALVAAPAREREYPVVVGVVILAAIESVQVEVVASQRGASRAE